jgi:hypothetical protein
MHETCSLSLAIIIMTFPHFCVGLGFLALNNYATNKQKKYVKNPPNVS